MFRGFCDLWKLKLNSRMFITNSLVSFGLNVRHRIYVLYGRRRRIIENVFVITTQVQPCACSHAHFRRLKGGQLLCFHLPYFDFCATTKWLILLFLSFNNIFVQYIILILFYKVTPRIFFRNGFNLLWSELRVLLLQPLLLAHAQIILQLVNFVQGYFKLRTCFDGLIAPFSPYVVLRIQSGVPSAHSCVARHVDKGNLACSFGRLLIRRLINLDGR